jgi:hypothetical protein
MLVNGTHPGDAVTPWISNCLLVLVVEEDSILTAE